MRFRPSVALTALVLWSATAGGAPSQSEVEAQLSRAVQEAHAVHYGAALDLARGALESGRATPAQTFRAHALLGELSASVGESAAARGHFERALELDPSYRPPTGSSPRLLTPFEQARASTPHPLRDRLEPLVRRGKQVELHVIVESDDHGLLQAGRVRTAEGPWLPLVRQSLGAYRASFDAAGSVQVTAALLDEWGNALMVLTQEAPAEALAAPPPVQVVEVPRGRAWYARPGPYLAVTALAALGAGVGFGVQALSEQNQLVRLNARRDSGTLAQARALDAARHRDVTVMWVGLGAGVALGGSAILLW